MEKDERSTHQWCRVAVVVDCDDESLLAVQAAVDAARRHHTRLTVICVAARPWFSTYSVGISPQMLESELMTAMSCKLARLASALPADLPCTTYVRCGRLIPETLKILDVEHADVLFIAAPAERSLRRRAIRRLIRRTNADVVVLGSETRKGSVSERLPPAARPAGVGAVTATAALAEVP